MLRTARMAVLAAVVSAPLAAPARSAEPEPSAAVRPNYEQVDVSRWRCRLCPFEASSFDSGTLTAGVVHVDAASARFGRDTGLDQAGARADLSGTYRRRGLDGNTTEVVTRRLGLDSRAVDARVRRGRAEIVLSQREIPRVNSTDGRTPFVGGAALELPDGWVAAFDTAAMTGLAGAQSFERATQRSRTSLGVRFRPHRSWWLGTDYVRESRTGTEKTSADFLYQATALPAPVDHRTDELTASAGWTGRSSLVAFEWRTVRFRNGNDAVVWENPWRGPVVRESRLSLSPDNRARDVTLVGRTILGSWAVAHATLTWGEAHQNERFVPYTTNPRLDSALPATDLDGLVRSLAATANLVVRPTRRMRVTVKHLRRSRDDASAELTLTPVLGDLVARRPVPGRRFDFATSNTELGLTYRPWRGTVIDLRSEANRTWRDPAEIARNDERRHRIEVRLDPKGAFRTDLRFEAAERDASEFRHSTRNNPLTRRYHQAEREERAWRARLGYAQRDGGLSFDLVAACRRTRHPASVLGLGLVRDCERGAEAGYAPRSWFAAHGFVFDHETVSRTAGRTGFTGSGWRYRTDDAVATAGLNVAVAGGPAARFRLSLDYAASLGAGRYATEVDDETLAFPTLVSNHRSLKVELRYRWRGGSAVRLRVRRESYRSEDWALVEDLTALRNVLTFGEAGPRYTINLVALAYEVSFGR